jgi:hypothetical protein
MINLKKQLIGDDILVEISGDNRNQVVQSFWSFWNSEATSGEFCWTNDGFGGSFCGYFWTTIEKLKKSCCRIELNKLVGVNGDITPDMERYAEKLGENYFNSIKTENFYKVSFSGNGEFKLIENREKEDTI